MTLGCSPPCRSRFGGKGEVGEDSALSLEEKIYEQTLSKW